MRVVVNIETDRQAGRVRERKRVLLISKQTALQCDKWKEKSLESAGKHHVSHEPD